MLFFVFFIICFPAPGYNYFVDFHTSFQSGKYEDFPFWNETLDVMSYHRSKMNEYLCKNYIASEIVENYQNLSNGNVGKRVGEPSKNIHLSRNSLMDDPGSNNYKNWLARSDTLEDIYRQFEHSEESHTSRHEAEPGHEGDVTGYALVGHKHLYSKPIEYGGDSHFLDGHLDSHDYHDKDDEYEEKGVKLKELFHFALNAIAFLAFATFMIEVIMCLMEMPQTTDPDYVLIPTSTGGTGPASKDEEPLPVTYRTGKGWGMTSIPLETLNVMSSKVLSSIEALFILHEDDGRCLRRALCENSKYSKNLPGIQKIWLPIWSLGASWIARRLVNGKVSRGTDTLQYLKAMVMGLGNEQCQAFYAECSGKMRRRKRKTTQRLFVGLP